MPIKIRDGFLKSEEIVHSAHDDVDSGGVPSLSPQIILEREVVTFAEELQKVEERYGEVVTRKDFTHGCMKEVKKQE